MESSFPPYRTIGRTPPSQRPHPRLSCTPSVLSAPAPHAVNPAQPDSGPQAVTPVLLQEPTGVAPGLGGTPGAPPALTPLTKMPHSQFLALELPYTLGRSRSFQVKREGPWEADRCPHAQAPSSPGPGEPRGPGKASKGGWAGQTLDHQLLCKGPTRKPGH